MKVSQVGYRIHGSGNEEKVEVAREQLIHEGELKAAEPLRQTLTVPVPPRGPISFTGEHVNCEWLVRVRLDLPLWPDKRLDLPFLVTPRLAAADLTGA